MSLDKLKKELLNNPDFKAEYEKYDLAFEIGQMVIEARIKKGITQEHLALLVGTKQSGIARLERGYSLPSLTFLNKIAQAFNTNLLVRFGFSDQEKIKVDESSSSATQLTDAVIMGRAWHQPMNFSYSYDT